jgi:hypothetical protein
MYLIICLGQSDDASQSPYGVVILCLTGELLAKVSFKAYRAAAASKEEVILLIFSIFKNWDSVNRLSTRVLSFASLRSSERRGSQIRQSI